MSLLFILVCVNNVFVLLGFILLLYKMCSFFVSVLFLFVKNLWINLCIFCVCFGDVVLFVFIVYIGL